MNNTNKTIKCQKQNGEYQIIYSLRIRRALRKAGFDPIMETDNFKKPGYKCWMYENTDDFKEALSAIFEGRA